MKKLILTLFVPIAVIILLSFQPGTTGPLDVLRSIELVDSFKAIESDTLFSATYEVWVHMPLNHFDSNSPTFPLRLYYSHSDFNKPMVSVIDGYTMYTPKANELTRIIDGNQLTIEHRFFSRSRPKDSIPWSYLNIRQAAADAHAVIMAFKPFYRGKWISTGISKSGQATLFHRRFYPNDVAVSVPYVAPLNFSDEDRRVYDFLDNKAGTPECRKKIYRFQQALFRNKSKIFPLFCKLAREKHWKFSMGLERAYDLSVLEYQFAFWQWGHCCKDIPGAGSSAEALFSHWKEVEPFSFFSEQSIARILPFFYQSLTEIGMYGYNIEPFRSFLPDTSNITFHFTLPKGIKVAFDSAKMRDINRWVRDSGNYILYIYGQNDAWSATAVDPGKKTNAVKMVCPNGSHKTRIDSFPKPLRDSIKTVLESWLNIAIL